MPKDVICFNMPSNQWKIELRAPFEGFAPAYWANTYPSYGRKAQSGAMQNLDITNPDFFTQGPGLATLTSGTEAGNCKTLIAHILNKPSSANVTWGTGGKYVYKISATAVSSAIEIAGVGAETGKSVVYYNGYVYAFYNDAGAAGEIAKVTASNNAIDPDWGSTVPATGKAALLNADHPSILAGDGNMYFGNGRYVGYYDFANDILSVDELDLYADVNVVDLVWEKNFLFIATNSPNVSGNNTNKGVIYTWAGAGIVSFQEPIIEVDGKIGALIVKNGVVFVFYQELSSTSSFKIGYVNGDTIQEVGTFSGTLPQFGQVDHYKGLIAFVSDALVHVWGATDKDIPIALSQLADGGFTTVGALSNPFGTPMVASNQSTSYKLAKFSGYAVNSNNKTLMFDVATSVVDSIKVHFEKPGSGARCDIVLRYNRGDSDLSLAKSGETGSITNTNDSAKYHKTFEPEVECDDFRLEFDYTNGSTSNPLKIRKIEIKGHLVAKV